jgi:hypothetical protein
MADWPGWWRYVRDSVDRSEVGRVSFTVDAIRAGARCRDQNIPQRWWWDLLRNPNAHDNVGLTENGLDCELHPETGPVNRVEFFRGTG